LHDSGELLPTLPTFPTCMILVRLDWGGAGAALTALPTFPTCMILVTAQPDR